MWLMVLLACQAEIKTEANPAPSSQTDTGVVVEPSQSDKKQHLPIDGLLGSFHKDCLITEGFGKWLYALGDNTQGSWKAASKPPIGWEKHWTSPKMLELPTYYLFTLEGVAVSYLNYQVISLSFTIDKKSNERGVEISLSASSKKIDPATFAPAMEMTPSEHGITLSCKGIAP